MLNVNDMSAHIQHSTLNTQHSRIRVFLVIAVIALIPFLNLLFQRQVPTFRDHTDYFQPLRFFTADEIHAGRLPLWNSYSASGEPWLANPQTGVFYPPTWLFLVLPFETAYVLFLALHVMLAGWGGFLLFSRFASSGAALAAALALMFSGPVMSMLDINNNLATFAWLPLVVWCALAGVAPQWSALVIAMSFLAGEPFFAAAGALAYALIRRRGIIDVALTSVALCAVQLFPFLDAVRDSDRTGGMATSELLRDSMPLRDWLAVLSPVEVAQSQRFIVVAYVGVLTVVFAALAVRRLPAAAAVVVACMIVGAGAYLAPVAALLTHLPVALVRYPARVLPLAALALCALAAIGVDRAVRPRWLWLVAAVMCIDPLLRALPLLAGAPFDARPVPYARAVGRDAKLIRAGFERSRHGDRRAWIAGYLNLYDRRFDVWTAAPFVSKEYVSAYNDALRQRSPAALDAMSCGYVVREQDGRVVVLRNPSALPMAYVRADDGRIAPASWSAFNSVALHVGVDAPFDGTLVVTQQDARGWRATVDGQDAQTFRAGVFRAVRVARGHHEITWRYRPPSLVIGAIITSLALARLLLSMMFVKRISHQKFFGASLKIA